MHVKRCIRQVFTWGTGVGSHHILRDSASQVPTYPPVIKSISSAGVPRSPPITPSPHLPIFPSPHHPISPSPQPSLPLLSPRGVHAASPSCGPPPGDQRRANYCFLFSRPCGSARRGSPSVRPTILCGDLEVAQARISVSLVTAGPSTGHIRPPRRSNASAAHLCFRFQVREQGGRVFHGTPNRRL